MKSHAKRNGDNERMAHDLKSHVEKDEKKASGLMISPLTLKWLRQMVKEPRTRPHTVASKIGEKPDVVGHSYATLRAKRDFAREFSNLFLEAEKKGVFADKDKDVYVPRRGGRTGLAITWKDGEHAPGKAEDVKLVQEIFAELEQGDTPTVVAERHGLSREGVYKIARNYEYVELGIVEKTTFDAVHPALDKAPLASFEKFAYDYDGVKRRWEPNQDKEKYLRIIELREKGKTMRQIAKTIFGSDDSKTERKVCSVIHDPWYAGYKYNEKGELERVPWITPIIDLEERWKGVQKLDYTNKWLRDQFEANLKRVEDLLPATQAAIQSASGFKVSAVYTYLRTLRDSGKAVRLFNGVWHKKDTWTDAINEIVQERNWRSFKVRMGWDRRDKILKLLLEQPLRWSEIIDRTGLPSDSVSWWLEFLQKDGITKKDNDKYYIPPPIADDLYKLYGALGKPLDNTKRQETEIMFTRKPSREKYEEIRSYMDQWVSIEDLAAKTGYTRSTVEWHLRNMRDIERKGGRGRAILTVRLKPQEAE